ncbi:cytochrome ubiquinol oxidase subunit I [Fulvivirga sediminis]|uniref:Cytochrome ubiquinol oxidase subunit I n=1 Tax=Fulvivirga sediminis TaxID=2803949 RepID=A0A937FDQ9_9BACT|nr:cytochrome ubiquinol oxidase subunit I [Fulvivirga sediminis]MBL3658533.1 cytochrome ubiquinol oxidase subunit I [Fulvivirga sediminis]
MTVEDLSRLQFAFTAMFHYIFPPFSIGMGLLLVIFESMYYFTRKKVYEVITRFWIKVFAANFSVGVATGIVLEFEFGTNWATYSRFVGDVFGSPLAAEGIFAFFLESGFLAVLLFGWNKVKPGFHLFATAMVALGSVLSGFWIIVANSWQQTPVAYELVQDSNGFMRAVITDFWQMVFNPSSMSRFSHAIVGAYVQGAFLVLSVSAYFLLKEKHLEFAKRSFVIALVVASIASLLQPLIGHESAHVAYEHQPAKMAAFEGLYETQKNAPMYLFGYVDEETETTKGIAVPGALSFLLDWDTDYEVKGLDQFPKEEHPPVNSVFQSYHLMVALGMFFIGITLLALFLWWRKKLFDQRWLLKIFVAAVVLPVIANQAGWYSAERGRQPWLVYGLLKTEDGISKAVSAPEVYTSLILFGLVYMLLLFSWLYVLNKEIKHGPESHSEMETDYRERHEQFDSFNKSLK